MVRNVVVMVFFTDCDILHLSRAPLRGNLRIGITNKPVMLNLFQHLS